MKTAFEGEVQFAGYTDSSRNGPRVTLRLADRDELQRFVGLEGKRFMVALVEIGDDGKPVGGGPAEPETQDAANRRMRGQLDAMPVAKGGPLAMLAGQLCEDPAFQAWMAIRYRHAVDRNAPPAKATAALVRWVCEVDSRAKLDHDLAAADRFHTYIRKPYLATQQGA